MPATTALVMIAGKASAATMPTSRMPSRSPGRAVIDDGRLHLHAVHLQRQTKAIESIRSYVAIWFWLTIVGAVLFAIAINNS